MRSILRCYQPLIARLALLVASLQSKRRPAGPPSFNKRNGTGCLTA